MDELVARINELYHKKQREGLTQAEQEEQQRLRRRYIDNVKANFRREMQQVKRVDK